MLPRTITLIISFLLTAMASSKFNTEKLADTWLEAQKLNPYGDAEDTMYMGGTPLFNEMTGVATDRMTHLEQKFPTKPWLKEAGDSEIDKADAWLTTHGKNKFGDSEDTVYAGGSPLFDERTGELTDRLEYLKKKFQDEPWK